MAEKRNRGLQKPSGSVCQEHPQSKNNRKNQKHTNETAPMLLFKWFPAQKVGSPK